MQKTAPTRVEHVVKENDFLVSKTDSKGKITYCNPPFMEIAGFSENELLGKPHSIVRHPDMPRLIFKTLWDGISDNKEIFAYVKNLSVDGGYYWVFANITASLDSNGNIYGYYSVRRKPNPKALDVIIPLYEKLLSLENSGGIDSSAAYLNEVLKDKGISYDQFTNNLQRL